jgi:polysaccharide biosynthesis/export protein
MQANIVGPQRTTWTVAQRISCLGIVPSGGLINLEPTKGNSMKSVGYFPLRTRPSWWRGAAIALVAAITIPSAARCEYLLQAGDVVEISTIGSNDLKQASMIREDGNLFLPLVGELKAKGLSISELRAKVISALSTKVLRRRADDGREFPVVISTDQLSLTISEYTPIYVMGDVAKPGSQQFRPGMTVRQAIALAGGYDINRFRMENPFLQSADQRAEYESLWIEFAQKNADALRIKTELANGTKLDRESILKLPIAPSLSENIVRLENELLAARNEQNEKEIGNLNAGIEQESKRIATLATLEKKESEGTKADQDEYERVKQLFDKGSVLITRVSDMRRLILISATSELQTTVQRYGVERERHELATRLQRFSDDRKIKLLGELQTAEADLATLRSRLQAAEEKLVYTSMVKSQLTRGEQSNPDLIIHSKNGKSQGAESVSPDTELQAGDVLEVNLHVAPLPPIQESSTNVDMKGPQPR